MINIVRSCEPRFIFLKRVPKGGVVLDCGCGDFESSNKLRNIRSDLQWHSLDLIKGKALPDGVQFKTCNFDCEAIPYADSFFDAVYALHVLEHINNLALYSMEIFRVLKPGGHLFIEVPSVKSILAPSSNFYDDITHKKPYTITSLKCFIQQYCNIDVITVKTARNPVKICLTPLLVVYGFFKRSSHYMIGFGDLIGTRLYGIGKKRM